MTRLVAVALLLCGTSAVAAPPVFIPRLDAEGFPLPGEAIRRLGSARFMSNGAASPVGYISDGRTLITSGTNIVAWDAISGRARWEYSPRWTHFGSTVLSADGKTIWAVAVSHSGNGANYKTELIRLSTVDGSRLGKVLCSGGRSDIYLSPTGNYSVQRNLQQVDLLDGITGGAIGSWKVPEKESIFGMALAPDGRRVVIGSNVQGVATSAGPRVRVVDLKSGGVEKSLSVGQLSANGNQFVFRFSSDSRYLYALMRPAGWSGYKVPDSEMLGWDLKTGATLFNFSVSATLDDTRQAIPNRLDVSPDGKTVVVGGWDRPVTVHDLPSGKERCRLPSMGYTPVTFDVTGKILAVGGGAITQWDVATGKRLPHSAIPYGLAFGGLTFSPDGSRLIVRPYQNVDAVEWDVRTGRELARTSWETTFKTGMYGRTGNVITYPGTVVVRSPDERLIARFVYKQDDPQGLETGTIVLGDARTWKYLRTLPRYSNYTQGLAFSPDGRFLVCDAHNIAVYDTAAGKILHTIEIAQNTASDSNSTISQDGRIFPCPNSRYLAVLEINAHGINKETGRWSTWEVGVYDLLTGKEFKRYKGDGTIHTMSWSPDGTRLAVVGAMYWADDGKNGIVFVGDLTSEHPPLKLKHVDKSSSAVALTPDGRTMATANNDGIRLWEVATGKVRHTFVGHRSTPVKLAFSHDGKQLAASAADGLLLWDVAGVLSVSTAAVDLERAWADLAGDDASAAFRAVRRLAANPDRSLPFLAKKCADAPPMPDANRIPALIQQLDAPVFADREEAQAALVRLGALATKAVRTASENHPSQEVRQRAQRILATPHERTSDQLRAIRVVEVMNRIGTPDAVQLLQRWARGPAWAPLTAEASREAERLTRN